MHDGIMLRARRFFRLALIAAGVIFSLGISGCGSSEPTQPQQGPHRYPLTGRVVSLEKDKSQVTVDAADIPGFMSAMTMQYSVKSPNLLDSISPEDRIKADVVVNGDDVWLENIVVVKKADPAKSPVSNESHPGLTTPAKQ